jgi:hypothetical protein
VTATEQLPGYGCICRLQNSGFQHIYITKPARRFGGSSAPSLGPRLVTCFTLVFCPAYSTLKIEAIVSPECQLISNRRFGRTYRLHLEGRGFSPVCTLSETSFAFDGLHGVISLAKSVEAAVARLRDISGFLQYIYMKLQRASERYFE